MPHNWLKSQDAEKAAEVEETMSTQTTAQAVGEKVAFGTRRVR